MSQSLLGNANYDKGFTKRNWWKLKDGQQVFRILPPVGDLQKNGQWSAFWNVHYGYKNTKKQMRVFQSSLVKNRKTKMIESPDAALERIEKLKAQFEAAKKEGNTELAKKLDLLVGQKGQYNLDSNHYMNAMDQQGNVGLLRIRHRAKLALDLAIKKLRDKGVDPLSVENGRFFIFTRSGSGLDTTFTVDVLEKELDIAGVGNVKQEIVHTLTPEIINSLLAFKDNKFVYKAAARLDTLFKRPTSAEVARIVTEGATAVDDIIDAKTDENTTVEPDPSDFEPEHSQAPATALPPQALATPSSPAPAAVAPTPVAVATPQPAQTAAAAAPAPSLVSSAPPVNTSQPSQTTAQAINLMSDEDFLKSLGV